MSAISVIGCRETRGIRGLPSDHGCCSLHERTQTMFSLPVAVANRWVQVHQSLTSVVVMHDGLGGLWLEGRF